MGKFRVTGAVAVVRSENKSERYLYRDAVFEDDGLDPANLKHLQTVGLIEKFKSAGSGTPETVTLPDGEPSEKWTVPQLELFASEKQIDLSGASGKPEKLTAILTALTTPAQ